MEPFRVHKGIAAPLDRANIDTDAIIPKQFLKRIERSGFGQFLFYDWRFQADGTPIDSFVLAREPYSRAAVLVAGPNFGCGSSREHAPWALLDFGFRVIISSSFADIFYNNCFKNGVLPVTLPEEDVRALMDTATREPGSQITVDLERQVVVAPDGRKLPFAVDEYRRTCLLNGWDDIGLTLRYEPDIAAYEKRAPFAVPVAAGTR